jgi:hypothetical protein
MRASFLIFCILSFQTIFPQNWQVVGDTVASDWEVWVNYITFDKSNIPHLAFFSNQSHPNTRPALRKFNGTQWVQVGPNADTAFVTSMGVDFDTLNRPWLFYNNSYDSAKASCRYYNGSTWISKGNEFTGPGSFNHIKISPDNTPYVVFRDKYHNYSASVMKFNGTNWQYVGQPGFTPQAYPYGAMYTRLAFNKAGKIYLAYSDDTNNGRASVMTFNGTSWVYVGSPDISGMGTAYTSIVFDSSDKPIIAYVGGSQSNIYIKRFTGTSWVSVGPASGIATGSFPDIAIDKNDNLYVVYTANDKPCVQKYSGGNWSLIGSALSPTIAMYTSIAVDSSGIPYISYQDFTDRYKNGWGPYHCATVLKYNPSVVTGTKTNTLEKQSIFTAYPNPATSAVQVKFNSTSFIKGTLRILDVEGELLHSENVNGIFEKEYSFSGYSKGVYFIEFTSPEAAETKKIVLE